MIAGLLVVENLRSLNPHHNTGMRVTKAQYIDATMAFMEKSGVFNIRYEKWFVAAANVLMMMIAFITFKSSLVPLFEGL